MIYLASSSPRRRKILKGLGVRFKIILPDYYEKPLHVAPAKLVRAHALGKALSVVPLIKEGKILSADTIVYFRRKIIGKPAHQKDAVRILGSLQGQWHEVYTGAAVLTIKEGKIKKKVVLMEKSKVFIRPMSRKKILNYFKKINPLDKAGAYAIQSQRASIVQEVKGSFFNVAGLPVERLRKHLKDYLFDK